MSLLAIISQQLIPNIDGKRSLACEILIATQAIKALIREDNVHQIDNYIKSGKKDGMIKMDDSILELHRIGEISDEDAIKYAIDQKLFVEIFVFCVNVLHLEHTVRYSAS